MPLQVAGGGSASSLDDDGHAGHGSAVEVADDALDASGRCGAVGERKCGQERAGERHGAGTAQEAVKQGERHCSTPLWWTEGDAHPSKSCTRVASRRVASRRVASRAWRGAGSCAPPAPLALPMQRQRLLHPRSDAPSARRTRLPAQGLRRRSRSRCSDSVCCTRARTRLRRAGPGSPHRASGAARAPDAATASAAPALGRAFGAQDPAPRTEPPGAARAPDAATASAAPALGRASGAQDPAPRTQPSRMARSHGLAGSWLQAAFGAYDIGEEESRHERDGGKDHGKRRLYGGDHLGLEQ